MHDKKDIDIPLIYVTSASYMELIRNSCMNNSFICTGVEETHYETVCKHTVLICLRLISLRYRDYKYQLSRGKTFPTRLHCAMRKLRSTCALRNLTIVFAVHSVPSQKKKAFSGGQPKLRSDSAATYAGWSHLVGHTCDLVGNAVTLRLNLGLLITVVYPKL